MMAASQQSWRSAAIGCALTGLLLPVAARVACPQGADVQVEWRPSVDAASRQQIEAQLTLLNPRKLPDTYTWRYDLRDLSRENIRALVTNPAVEDTQEIDRQAFTLESTAPRTTRRPLFSFLGDTLVQATDGLALLLLIIAGVTVLTRKSPADLIQRAVPELDAATAGMFRIIFGITVLVYFMTHRVDASWLTAKFDLEVEGVMHRAVMQWFRENPAFVDLLTPWLLLTGAAFTVGFLTRATYALFAIGVLAWAFVAISIQSTHPVSPLVLAVVALLPSRWGDALSIDAWWRRAEAAGATSNAGRIYGYSVWVPSLVFGLAFAAAAWAKLSVPPGWTDWILNGTVKYHFITDSVNAPVRWGLQLAHHPWLAVLASLVAVGVELLVVTSAFVRHDWYRLGLGTAALSLLAGFALFMGVFWPGWWVLLLSFLPWRRIGRRLIAVRPASQGRAVGSPRALTVAQLAMAFAVVAQQVVVSAIAVERAPMFSWYDMYSATYASPDTWNRTRPPVYRIVVTTAHGNVELTCNPHGEFIREFEAALDGSAQARRNVWRALEGCGQDISDARQVVFEGDRRVFDWDRLIFTTTRSVSTLGPLAAMSDGTAPR